MRISDTYRMMYEKKDSPPWNTGKQDYAGAAKELRDYAMKDGGIDKKDMLSVASQLASQAKSPSASVGARMMRNIQGLDTDVREKIFSVLKKHGLKESLELDLKLVEEMEEVEIEEAMVRGKEVYDKTFANRTQADNFAKKNGGRVKQVGRVFYVFKEDVDEAKRDPSKSGGSGYDLYHKDFSTAMQHAYKYAKDKLGITIDPKEIDNKVASGPRKPSAGKTNTYRLKGDKGSVQIQVANLDNKKYELNMYKEEVELEESPMVSFTVPNVTSDMASKLERLAKENDVEYSRKGRTVVLKGKRIDVTSIRTKMGIAQTNLKMVPVNEGVELNEREDIAMQVARALKKMGVKPNAKEAEVTKKIPDILDKMKLTPGARRMISRDPDFLGDVFDSLKEEVEIEEAYKTPAEASAYEAGKKAVAKGVSYDDNPNKKGTKEYTAWSKGHNDARARKIARKEEVEMENIEEAEFFKWEVKVGGRSWRGTARNAGEAVKKARPSMGNLDLSKASVTRIKEDIDVEEKTLTLEEAVMLSVFGEAKKDKKAPETDKDDDGEGMDAVDKKALKKDYDDRAKDGDGDIDNDGDEDKTDKYLHKRRQAVTKAIGKKKGPESSKKGEPVDTNPTMDEEKGEEMSSAEKEKKDEIMKKLEQRKQEFENKYGDRAKEVMARTAIKMAKKHA